MSGGLARGGMRVTHASRRFKVVHEKSTTLKELLIRRKRTSYTELWALDDVSFEIRPGEAVGIVGRNGSGKSTLLKLLARIIPPHSGTVEAGGSVASMLELGAGFHPDFTGRENVFMNGAIHGLSDRDVAERLDEIVDFAGLAEFIDMPVRTYSSGMQMRLAFAVASHVEPDIMLLDEVLAVGDEAFQRKCMGRIYKFRRRGGTLVFVSHDPNAVEHVCSRAILLDGGKVLMDGEPHEVMKRYHRLLAADTAAPAVAVEAPAADDGLALPIDGALGGWGTRDAVVEDVQVLSSGEPTASLMSGDPAEIAILIRAPQPVTTPSVGISITLGDGTLLFGTNTRLSEFPLDTLHGRARILFSIPSLALHEGTFDVTVAVHSQDESTVYHWLDRAASFAVYARDPGVGPAAISGHWVLDADHTPAATG